MSPTLKRPSKTRLFGKGKFAELAQEIRSDNSISCVFVNVEMLTGLQLVTLQTAWKLPVYDRYVSRRGLTQNAISLATNISA